MTATTIRSRRRESRSGKLPTLTHIFIDFENVRPTSDEFARVPRTDVHVWLLHGAHQKEFAATLVREWLPLGERMHLAQSTKTGKNAVDMVLAYCLGEARQLDRQAARPARYLIVSKDKDYDALLAHVERSGTTLERSSSLTQALEQTQSVAKSPPTKESRSTVSSKDVDAVVKNLSSNVKNRPAKRVTLERNIHSLLGGKITPAVTQAVVDALVKKGVIRFDGVKVVYQLT